MTTDSEEFAYHLRCPSCGAVFDMGTQVIARKLTAEPAAGASSVQNLEAYDETVIGVDSTGAPVTGFADDDTITHGFVIFAPRDPKPGDPVDVFPLGPPQRSTDIRLFPEIIEGRDR